MNYIRQHSLVSALLVNLVLFSGFFVFAFPIYHSGDDVYLLYTLAGGFGQAPTELLHYHYGMHPYLGWMLKNLFVQYPGFNWFTGLLYLFHFIACTAILTLWMRKNPAAFIAGCYALLFFGIEIHFLLHPSFTNTAFVTAAAGLLMLYVQYRQRSGTNNLQLFIGWLLVFVATMLRLHLLIPALLLSAPFFLFAASRHQLPRFFVHALATTLFIAAFVLVQRRYYNDNISGWRQEEKYRQTVIAHYNIPKAAYDQQPEATRISADFLEKGILWDKDFLSEKQVMATTKAIKLTGAWQQSDFRQKMYWVTIEYRLGIAILALMLFWKFPSLNKREKIAVMSSGVLLAVMCAGLLLFRKLPGYIVTGGMLQWMAFTGLPGRKLFPPSPVRRWLLPLTAALLLSWSLLRVKKTNLRNIHQYGQWRCAYKQVAKARDKLFVVTDDRFPADYFHVWHTPRRYPLPNLLYKDHFLNNTYQSAFEKFGIQSSTQFLHNTNIVFTGVVPATLLRYYEIKTGNTNGRLRWVETRSCVQTWQLY
ncbi:MAG TPA: hypothetical protein VD993_14820 [Chitinophagaceae bacterium]|nr:hypothetical protein [Chitinophagaceae bacterium]